MLKNNYSIIKSNQIRLDYIRYDLSIKKFLLWTGYIQDGNVFLTINNINIIN